jgi:nucleoside-diphosphate kinase
MTLEKTLCILKPDALEQRKQGAVLQMLLDAGFKVLAMQQVQLTQRAAEGFYAVHRERPFFGELVAFMTRGPVIVLALARENAVQHLRTTIGATDPAKAADGTVRKAFGKNVGENAVHGSDSVENGALECGYFFPGMNLV